MGPRLSRRSSEKECDEASRKGPITGRGQRARRMRMVLVVVAIVLLPSASTVPGAAARAQQPLLHLGDLVNGRGKCLIDPQSSARNGTQMRASNCHGGNEAAERLWRAEPDGTFAGNEIYKIMNDGSGKWKCLDLRNNTDGGMLPGTKIQQWACLPGHANQEWFFNRYGDAWLIISAATPGEALAVTGARDGAPAVNEPYPTFGENQLWSCSNRCPS